MNEKLTDIILAWYQMKGTCKELQKNIEFSFDLTEKKPKEYWLLFVSDDSGFCSFKNFNEAEKYKNNLLKQGQGKIIHVKEVL